MSRLTAVIALVAALGSGTAQAQDVNAQPAEFPPASYKGKQYVDSKGCVFIRAGIDGDVSWIPRVTRARKAICGFTPSLGAQVEAPAPEPAAPAEEPVQITVDTAPAPAANPAPAAQVRRPVAPAAVRQSARAPKRRAARRQTPAPAPIVQIPTACPGASPLGQQYLPPSVSGQVRCGPQTAPIAARPGRQAGVRGDEAGVTAHTRIVPKHVAINRLNTRNVSVPKGYRKVWDDGRLNPNRAEQTLAGRQQMLLIWTQTVPRRLINQTTGRDVTVSVPLVYPYLDVATQTREIGEVKIVRRNGKIVKRVIRQGAAKPAARAPVYSTRSTPQTPAPNTRAVRKSDPALAGKRFVQIGLFSTTAKAQRAARHLSGLGLPAQIGKLRRGGKTYLTVQAGPFRKPARLQSALRRLRGFGYTGAQLR